MITERISHNNVAPENTSWASVAFIVESILLLVFLAASLAVLTKVFSASLNASIESRTLDAATIAAGSVAERFASDPTDVDERTELGDLLITCDVTNEKHNAGTLYHAKISAYDKTGNGGADPIYSIKSARYVPDKTSTSSSATTTSSTSSESSSAASASAAATEPSAAAAEPEEGSPDSEGERSEL